MKADYLAGELTAGKRRELRAELEPAAEAADRECERLFSQLQGAESDPTLVGIEAGLLERLDQIRAALAGQVTDAAGVDAVRATLMRVFDRFVLHKGCPHGRANLDLIGEGYWIEPIASEEIVASLAGIRQEQAENNFNQTLVYQQLFWPDTRRLSSSRAHDGGGVDFVRFNARTAGRRRSIRDPR